MLRVIFLVVFCLVSSASYADETACLKLSEQADGADDNYRPPLEATVIGTGRLKFYTAPNSLCQMKGVFVIKGDVLTVYKSYKGWANVMFIGKEDDYIGWVPENRLNLGGHYGPKP